MRRDFLTTLDGVDAVGAQLHVHDGTQFATLSAAEWRAAAGRKAGGLRRAGVSAGTRVGCVLTNSVDVCTAIFGTWFAGGVVVSLPTLPRGMDPESYVRQLHRLCRHAEVELLLVEDQFAASLESLLADLDEPRPPVRSFESLDTVDRVAPSPPEADELAFVQYSSGSTRDPKGCLLTAEAIARQLEILIEVLEIDARRDRGVSWLPLSHDMGLFGCLLVSWTTGMPLVLSSPRRFLRSPRTWLSDLADFGGTITAGPSFGLAVMARAARTSSVPRRLPTRRWIVASDRIEWETLTDAAEALSRHGVDLRAFCPAYGLAEATLAVTMVRPDEEPAALHADSLAIDVSRNGEAAGWLLGGNDSASLVSCGRPLRGVEVEIDAEAGIGEIVVRSPSLAHGYVGDPIQTREHFVDGAVRTGDFGLLGDEGELYVVGRLDDMISVAGRKVYARDLEDMLGAAEGVRRGACVLIDVDASAGRPRLIAVAEPERGVSDHTAVARGLRDSGLSALGLNLDECLIVARGTIPKTASGKVQRFRCRQLVETGALATLARLE